MKEELMKKQEIGRKGTDMENCNHQLELFPHGAVQTADDGRDHDEVESARAQLRNQRGKRRANLASFKEVISRWRAKQMPLPLNEVRDRYPVHAFPIHPRTGHKHPKISMEVVALIDDTINRQCCKPVHTRHSVRVIHDILALRVHAENSRRKNGDKLSCPSRSSIYRIISQLEEFKYRAGRHGKRVNRRKRDSELRINDHFETELVGAVTY